MSDAGRIKSITAYKNSFQALSETPLQKLYDFASLSVKYSNSINNVKHNMETENIKKFLSTKGEFGQKLYDYIYAPVIKEKYDLLNKIAQSTLTEEQADTLRTKHLTIELEGRSYDHCIEKDVSYKTKDFYCYNDEMQVIDHIVIGADNIVREVFSLYE